MATLTEINRTLRERCAQLGLDWQCLGDGDVNSKLVIITESPGRRECELKIPLVGGSGQYLWKALERFGVRRQQCYITTVCKRFLLDDADKKGISKNEFAHWQALLEWELSQLPNAQHFLLLGAGAIKTLTGYDGVEKWRGSVFQTEGRTYTCAYNPANLLRKPDLGPIFALDCSKWDMCIRGAWKEHGIHAIINPSPSEAIAWCEKMIDEKSPISVDIEVKDNETACIGLANNAHEGMCINFRSLRDNRFTVRDEAAIRIAIQRALRHTSARLVMQNGAFDLSWLWYKDRIRCKALWIDTLLAHHALYPTWPHNLGFLTAQYTTHPFYKDEKSSWQEGGDIDSFWAYNVKDVCITWEVARKLDVELKQRGMDKFYFGHVMQLQPYLIQSTVLGNAVDLRMKAALEQQYGTDVEQKRLRVQELARIACDDPSLELNPNSPKQMAEVLFKRLKLHGKTTSTDKANRAFMLANPRTPEPARQLLIAINEYLTEHKLYSTYITAAVDEDGRMRSDYKQFGVQFVPGRLSSSSTLWGSGMNLQNQPERLRGMFIADRMQFDD